MARKSRKNIDANIIAPVITDPTYRVGAYVRLSLEDRKVKGDSIENQQALIKAFIEERPDLSLTDIYIDNGLSGQSFERPAFNCMIEDMESGKINCCVSKDLSRLGRNAIDTGYYIEKYFPVKGVRYIAINDNYDSADPKSGGVMVNLKNMVNEHYALEFGRKIRQTKQMNIRKGKFVGRLAPYGFSKSKEDKHILVHDPYAAPIVRTMFEMAAEGKGVRAIADWLNSNGILPPKRYFFSIGVASEKDAFGHEHWNKGVIYTLLRNRVYCGDMVQGKFKTHSYVQKTVPKSDWIIVEDTHDGIISRELFDAVQEQWADSKPRGIASYPDNMFLRKVYCGHCGLTLKRGANRKKDKFSLMCNTRHAYAINDCVPVRIDETELKSMLLDILNKEAEIMGIDVSGGIHTQVSKEQVADKIELQRLQAEINKNSHFLKSLYESLITHDITNEDYRELKTEYAKRIAALTENEREIRKNMLERFAKESATAKAIANLHEVRYIADLTAESIGRLIDKILVYDDKRIEVSFKFNDSKVTGGGCVGYERIEQAG